MLGSQTVEITMEDLDIEIECEVTWDYTPARVGGSMEDCEPSSLEQEHKVTSVTVEGHVFSRGMTGDAAIDLVGHLLDALGERADVQMAISDFVKGQL